MLGLGFRVSGLGLGLIRDRQRGGEGRGGEADGEAEGGSEGGEGRAFSGGRTTRQNPAPYERACYALGFGRAMCSLLEGIPSPSRSHCTSTSSLGKAFTVYGREHLACPAILQLHETDDPQVVILPMIWPPSRRDMSMPLPRQVRMTSSMDGAAGAAGASATGTGTSAAPTTWSGKGSHGSAASGSATMSAPGSDSSPPSLAISINSLSNWGNCLKYPTGYRLGTRRGAGRGANC